MGRGDVSSFVRRFKRVLSESAVNELGRAVRFCQRERVVTPYRLALSLLASFSIGRVETLADMQRGFNALFGGTVAYKPFHNQLAKGRFGPFMRALVARMLEHWVVRVLEVKPGGAFAEFEQIVIQDGSSFALKDALATYYPGRFKRSSPAAVELHVTMDLLEEAVTKVTLTADTTSERSQLPRAYQLRGTLLLADRGYFEVPALAAFNEAGVAYVIRGYRNINPLVLGACDDEGKGVRAMAGKTLAQCRLPKRRTLDLDVQWGRGERAVRARIIVSWNARKGEHRFLVTNLARERYSAEQITLAYRLRWQVELLFKEWKSYANLRAFDTANPSIAEGLIWAAIGAALLKRFLAHCTQRTHGVEISTRKVAMCAHHVLRDIMTTLASGANILSECFENAVKYLAANATRAHPKRDRRTGRLQLGLVPVLSAA